MARLTSREFNQDVSRAKRAADRGPVVITDRGEPAYVLLRYDTYRRLTAKGPTIVELLADPEAAAVAFEAPRLGTELLELPELSSEIESPAAFERGVVRAGTSSWAATELSYTSERLSGALQVLDHLPHERLVTHLFALRALLPTAIGDARGDALSALRDLLREEFDRLFIKLRLPAYMIAARDVETSALRSMIQCVLEEAARAHGSPGETSAVPVVLHGRFDRGEMRNLLHNLHESELASALPWSALTRLLPDSAPHLAHYRALLADRLDFLALGGASQFLDSLQHERDDVLGKALDVVLTALRAKV